MTVDFRFRRSPAIRIAWHRWKGAWTDARVRAEFGRLERSVRAAGLRSGRWVFLEPSLRSYVVGIELHGTPRRGSGLRVRTLPAARVASVEFDPEVVSPRVVYHGLTDWLRWRRKDRTIRSIGMYREIYRGNPWKDPKAWSRTEVQAVVR